MARVALAAMGLIRGPDTCWHIFVTDKTLIESGRFYPTSAITPEDRLRFYASQFPIVEINSSYDGVSSTTTRSGG
jgi:hypothetical protein